MLESIKSKPVRVLIVDGDPLICRALARLLKDALDVEVVATATDASVTLELAEQFQPAVALLDAGTVRLDGMTLTRSLRQQAPARPDEPANALAWTIRLRHYACDLVAALRVQARRGLGRTNLQSI